MIGSTETFTSSERAKHRCVRFVHASSLVVRLVTPSIRMGSSVSIFQFPCSASALEQMFSELELILG